MPPLSREDFQKHYADTIKTLVRKRIDIYRMPGGSESQLRIDNKDILLDRTRVVERLAEEITDFTARFYLDLVLRA